jgi:ATP-dependent DNA helicase RecQ
MQNFKESLEGYFKFNKSSTNLKQLAEDPKNIVDLFNLIVKKDGTLRNHKVLKSLQNQLSRFLESYMDNTALDYLSGLLRLVFDDFEDMDGRRRMKSALKNINLLPFDTQISVIDQTCNVIRQLDKDHQQKLIHCVGENTSDIRIVCRFNEKLENYSSSGFVLMDKLNIISDINKRLTIRNER